MKKWIIGLCLALSLTVLTACGGGQETSEEVTTIRVATSPGPYSEMFFEVVAPVLEDQGYTVEDIEFTDLRSANVGIQEGSADLNVDQHLLYMENFNQEADTNLTNLTPIPTVPTGIFPGTKDDLQDVEAGDLVAIPDDPSNLTRALLLLEKIGWITLDDSKAPINMTTDDIVDNVVSIEIEPVQSATIPRLSADIQYGIIPGSMAYDAGVDFNSALAFEDPLDELMLQAVVSEENADTAWAQAVVEAYQLDEVKAAFEAQNEGSGQSYWIIP